MRYRRKSLEVEAIQYTLCSIDEIRDLIESVDEKNKLLPTFSNESLVIYTPEKTFKVNLNDYLVKGFLNELYDSNKEIFEDLFEKVEEQ